MKNNDKDSPPILQLFKNRNLPKVSQEDITGMAEMLHDLYLAYIKTGFTKTDAMTLIKTMFNNNR